MVQHDVYFGEDFGQRVDLTQRIAEIIKNYPDNTILKELIQNADDACASTVRFVLDKRQHNTETLVYEKLASFQGPALIAYNDGVFSEDDFQSISRIGGSLKRDKVFKTGRFGIGFNSVYHVTDVPSFVSGDRICFFDPHADYLPHVSTTNPGKMLNVTTPKVRETIEKYPDQFAPYRLFGCTLESYFKGTMFRLPLRVPHLAKLSRISKVSAAPLPHRSWASATPLSRPCRSADARLGCPLRRPLLRTLAVLAGQMRQCSIRFKACGCHSPLPPFGASTALLKHGDPVRSSFF